MCPSLLPLLATLALLPHTAPDPGVGIGEIVDLGQIEFDNSGAPEAQEAFLRGVLLLHSFEYADAREAFQQAREVDPDFALAYWGEALTHSHPLWREEDVEAAREVLAQLAPSAAERQAKAGSAREKSFLASVELLYGDGDRIQRHTAYADALGEMWRRDPGDAEAGAFHALAILGTSLGVRDERIYMRAAAVGEEVYRANPRHPGALHYLIHSYDDPVHAPLGLRMAREYDKVAPAASHALHMPSHIYVALGMWDASGAANVNSVEAADARRARKGLGIDARGWHAFWWLHYTRLQQGRVEEAGELLAEMLRDTERAGSERTREHLVRMRAAHVVDTRDPEGPAAAIEVDLAELSTPTVAADHCARGLVALGRGDLESAKEIVVAMRGASPWEGVVPEAGATLASCCAPATAVGDIVDGPGRTAAEIMARELEGLIRLRDGDATAGIELLRSAAELEDTMGFDFGPPLVVLPAHEALGQALLASGEPRDAIVEFRAALARAPRRARSLLGLLDAARAAGDTALARETHAELAAVWHAADPGIVERLQAHAPGPGGG